MIDIKVNFLHPTDGRMITVDVDDTMTAQEGIAELLSAGFIQPNPQGYNLGIKGGPMIPANGSFGDADVKDGTTIRIIPATDAGAIL